MNRPTRHESYMKMAEVMSERSTCLSRKTGAVLVKDDQIIATGYNGAPKGLPHCDEVGCIRIENDVPSGERHELCRGVHAEQNAIIQSAYHGVEVKGGTLYTTTYPCSMCARVIINAGISEVIYKDDYSDDLSKKLLKGSDVEMKEYQDLIQEGVEESLEVTVAPRVVHILSNYEDSDNILFVIKNRTQEQKRFKIDIDKPEEIHMKIERMCVEEFDNPIYKTIDSKRQKLYFINLKTNERYLYNLKDVTHKELSIKVECEDKVLYDDVVRLRVVST